LNTIGALLSNVDYIFIGRFLGTAALGVYKLAFIIPEYLINQITSVLGGVIFPVYAKVRDDAKILNQAFIETVRYVSFVTIPLGFGLALVSEPLVLTFFSEKWVEAIPIIRAISIYALVDSLGYGTGAIFKAQGKVKYITMLAIVRVLIMIPLTWLAIHFYGTIEAVAWAQVVVVLLSRSIKLSVVWNIVRFSVRSILKIFVTMSFYGVIMSSAVYGTLLALDASHSLIQLVASILIGAVVYIGGFWIFDREFVYSTIRIVKETAKNWKN
jgi:O-antigen/teichoic acid export membrane protein